MSIFISHSSEDKIIIKHFVNKILIQGCGLSKKQIFCSSIDELGIKTGEDFRKYIKKKLINADYSFIMISDNYKRSEVCLNEMGASWALNKLKVRQFLFPNLGFESLGLLMNVQQAAKIDNSNHLYTLFKDITKHFNKRVSIEKWEKNKEDFLLFLKNYMKKNTLHIYPTPEKYFNSFIQEDINFNQLLLKAHPTLLDCKSIFSEKFYKDFFNRYCTQYEKIEKEYKEPYYPKYKYVKFTKYNLNDIKNKNLTGGIIEGIEKGIYNKGIEFYEVELLENKNSKEGFSIRFFCFIGDRWVFIRKPW